MAEYVSLYTSTVHRRSLSEMYAEFRESYAGEEPLDLLYRYPADLSIIGEMHRHNTDFGFKEVGQSSDETGCPCCCTQYRVSQQELSVSAVHLTPSPTQLAAMREEMLVFRIPSEVAAFFTQVKIIIFALVIRFLVFDLALFVKAYLFAGKAFSRVQLTRQGHLVDEDFILHDQLGLGTKLIIAFYKYDIIAFQLLLMVMILLVFFSLSHKFQLQVFQAIEMAQPYESRYAVMVQNIPLLPVVAGYEEARFENIPYQKRIKVYFKKYIKDNLIAKLKNYDTPNKGEPQHPLSKLQRSLLQTLQKQGPINFAKVQEQIVQEVIICYDNSALSRLDRQKEAIMGRFLNSASDSASQREMEKQFTSSSLKRINRQQLKLISSFNSAKNLGDKLPYFMGFAIVIFNYQHYRDFLIRQSLHFPSNLSMGGCVLVRGGQKPSVVEWSNFVQRKQDQLRVRLYTNSILAMVLLVTLVMLSYLQMYKIIPMIERWLHFPKKYQHRIKILAISGITSLINLLLSNIIQLLAESEKRLSKTGTTVSLLTKNVITQFINSALIYYLITFVTPASFLFQAKDLKQKVESLIIIPGVVRILVNFLNTKYLLKKFQFEIYSKHNFQLQFNRLYERPEFDFVSKYSYYIVQLLTVSFYSPLSPLIVPALALILPVVYYVDKLILFKKSSQPAKVSFRVTDWVHFLCQCSLLSFLVGWLLFCPDDLWSETVSIVSYLSLIIVLAYLAYRFKMVSNPQRYFCDMRRSTKSHEECTEIMMQRYRNYDPWRRFLRTFTRTESCTTVTK